jgi:hypothetical protein
MKYRIDWPIQKDCFLNCPYCFHREYHTNTGCYSNGTRYDRGFTMGEWYLWRDKFLTNAEKIVLNLHGGEPFFGTNLDLVQECIQTDINHIHYYDLLSNGLSPTYNYEQVLLPVLNRIERITFTYHRSVIQDNLKLTNQFIDTVLFVKSLGVKVFVKELLITKYREEIVKNIMFWKAKDVDVKVADFKGNYLGSSFEEYQNYNFFDHAIIHPEFKHSLSTFCSCMEGYKTLGIYGYDQFGGNVVGCWLDPCVVGNVKDDWFNPNYKVDRNEKGERNVVGVPKKYLGTRYKDRPIVPEQCKH